RPSWIGVSARWPRQPGAASPIISVARSLGGWRIATTTSRPSPYSSAWKRARRPSCPLSRYCGKPAWRIWTIEWARGAEKQFLALDPAIRRRIAKYLLERVSRGSNPRRLGRALKGERRGL